MKRVEVRKTSKEIIKDIKDLSLSEKLIAIGVICIMICLLMLFIALITVAFSEYGIVCGLFVTLVSVGIYAIFTGLCVNWVEDTIDLYKTEWVEDGK